ncbi:helix-turn-helix domain-containing protein [Alteromonas sp. RKMC-009]|uniref:helix-turn-helix domain-containing protein n=1 Tax=Alteromonas sp. RKMC-009 TaxID=2267264 RepID=UPI001E366DC6|nr:helix-turn-helix domain-containing protein [Alteromonas sp. RKMC-009]
MSKTFTSDPGILKRHIRPHIERPASIRSTNARAMSPSSEDDMLSLPPSFDGRQLRKLRLEAGFTQQQIADAVCLSRETVVAIENNKQSAIDGLKWKTVRNWCLVCKGKVRYETMNTFTKYLVGQVTKK